MVVNLCMCSKLLLKAFCILSGCVLIILPFLFGHRAHLCPGWPREDVSGFAPARRERNGRGGRGKGRGQKRGRVGEWGSWRKRDGGFVGWSLNKLLLSRTSSCRFLALPLVTARSSMNCCTLMKFFCHSLNSCSTRSSWRPWRDYGV